jgi:hypothetical protein
VAHALEAFRQHMLQHPPHELPPAHRRPLRRPVIRAVTEGHAGFIVPLELVFAQRRLTQVVRQIF